MSLDRCANLGFSRSSPQLDDLLKLIDTEELVDRTDEVAAVVQAIRQGSKLFMVGPRRFGKTSILKTSEDRLKTTDAVVLRFDAESYPGLDTLVTSLISTAAKSLKGPVERVGEQVRSFFSRFRPELSFNITQNAWSDETDRPVFRLRRRESLQPI